jgi:hypothetical protein
LKQTTKTDRQKQIDTLDDLFRVYIRKRAIHRVGGCERCGRLKSSYKDLQTAHCHTRSKFATRWHPDNAFGLCGGCHMYLDSHPEEKIAFCKEKLGELTYAKLVMESNMSITRSATDYALIEVFLRYLISELDLSFSPGYAEL